MVNSTDVTVNCDTGQCSINSLTVHIGHCTDVNQNPTSEYMDEYTDASSMCKAAKAIICGSAEKGQYPRGNTF